MAILNLYICQDMMKYWKEQRASILKPHSLEIDKDGSVMLVTWMIIDLLRNSSLVNLRMDHIM